MALKWKYAMVISPVVFEYSLVEFVGSCAVRCECGKFSGEFVAKHFVSE